MDDDKVIDLSAIRAEKSEASEPAQEKANPEESLEATANNFNNDLYDLLKIYQEKLPLVYIQKIISAVQVDIYAAVVATNMQILARALKEELAPSLEQKPTEPSGESELIIG